MDITAEQIERFFKKQCTSAEAAQVVTFLKANPAALDHYLSETEWIQTKAGSFMNDAYWDDVWKGIEKGKQKIVVGIWIKRSAVAACMVGLLCLGLFFLTTNKDGGHTASTRIVAEKEPALVSRTTHKTIRN